MESQQKRFLTNERGSVEVYGKSGRIQVQIKNLSSTGACLSLEGPTDVVLVKGDLIRLSVNLGTLRKRHNLSAEVVWQKGTDSGICFIKPEDVLSKMMDRL